MSVVLDASALVLATLGTSASAIALRSRMQSETCHAPHLIDAEYGNVLRSLVTRQELPADSAPTLLDAGAALIDHRYRMTGPLAAAAWALRDNLTFYDALYVSLAAALGLPLLTVDARLTRAPHLPCDFELLAP